MLKNRSYILIFLLAGLCSCTRTVPLPVALECNGAYNPVGVESEHPVLSWRVDGRHKNGDHVYRVLVSTDSLRLMRGIYDIWEYEVLNPEKLICRYNGPELQPATRYYWLVECRNNRRSTETSRIASFETGLSSQTDWLADWIEPAGADILNRSVKFTRNFDISDNPQRATLFLSANAKYQIHLNDICLNEKILIPFRIAREGSGTTPYISLDVSAFLHQGANTIAVDVENPPSLQQAVIPPRLRCQLEVHTGKDQFTIQTDESWSSSPGPYITTDHGIMSDRVPAKQGAEYTPVAISATDYGQPYSIFVNRRTVLRPTPPDKSWKYGDTLRRFVFPGGFPGVLSLDITPANRTAVYIRYDDLPEDSGTYGATADKYDVIFTEHDSNHIIPFGTRPFGNISLISDSPFEVSSIHALIPAEFPGSTAQWSTDHEFINSVLYGCQHTSKYRIWKNYTLLDGKYELSEADFYLFDLRPLLQECIGHYTGAVTGSRPLHEGYRMAVAFWNAYRFYDNRFTLEQVYPRLRDDYLAAFNNYVPGTNSTAIDGRAARNDIINTALLYNYSLMMRDMAGSCAREEDAARFESNADKLQGVFSTRYAPGEAAVGSRTVAELAVPVYYGITDRRDLNRSLESILEHLVDNHYRITGDESFAREILGTLTRHGLTEPAYRVARNLYDSASTSYGTAATFIPGILFPGASAVDPGHIYSAVTAWLFADIAGIRPGAHAGFRFSELIPAVNPEVLGNIELAYNSTYGTILSGFESNGQRSFYICDIPDGCRYVIHIGRQDGRSLQVEAGPGPHKLNWE